MPGLSEEKKAIITRSLATLERPVKDVAKNPKRGRRLVKHLMELPESQLVEMLRSTTNPAIRFIEEAQAKQRETLVYTEEHCKRRTYLTAKRAATPGESPARSTKPLRSLPLSG